MKVIGGRDGDEKRERMNKKKKKLKLGERVKFTFELYRKVNFARELCERFKFILCLKLFKNKGKFISFYIVRGKIWPQLYISGDKLLFHIVQGKNWPFILLIIQPWICWSIKLLSHPMKF